MSRSTRKLVRAALPPLLALGLLPLMIRPMDAAPVGTASDPAAGAQLPSTGRDLATCLGSGKNHAANGQDRASADAGAPVAPAQSGNVQVSIPAVAFTELIQVVNGRIHTPVLINVAEPCGIATVVGSPGTCRVVAHPGVVAWLDCALPRKPWTVTIEVRLASGAQFTHTAAVHR